jgi:hypothetical protein
MTMTDHAQKVAVARRFHATLLARDWSAVRALLADEAQWTLPGDNAVSGVVEGADAVTERARRIAGYGVKFQLLHILSSRDDVALGLRNTAERDGRRLDEHLATVLRVRDGKITAIETFLSDVEGMNAFFVKA